MDVIHDESSENKKLSLTNLKSLLGGMTYKTFQQQYLAKKPFLVTRQHPDFYNLVFTLKQAAELLYSKRLIENDIRVFKEGKKIPFETFANEDKSVNKASVLELYEGGSTIVFENVGRMHSNLAKLLAWLENQFHLKMRANAFLTPGESKGFKAHFDTHDVIVLQISGTKHWKIENNPIPLPTDACADDHSRVSIDKVKLIGNHTLKPGDLLYLPRGFIHSATACDRSSLHITISLRGHTYLDVLKQALRDIERSNTEMREYIDHRAPPTSQKLLEVFNNAFIHTNMQDVISKLYQNYLLETFPVAYKQLENNFYNRQISSITQLVVNPFMVWQSFTQKDSLIVIFDGKQLKLPSAANESLTFMNLNKEFYAEQLPNLSAESALKLCQLLFSHGFLIEVNDLNKETKEENVGT